ncbi:MAG: 2,3-bisphosphoglycerate-dependent phosphoglycerate mutase [Gammaproteobacteria bacterium]|jgi:2,3-bisphosphoglycerate-dependent phosphoglycerate mutase
MSKLVLLRHGESMWNKHNVFTGWVDVPLSKGGIDEAFAAGEKLSAIDFAVIYTSTLIRAMETVMLCMVENHSNKTPVVMHSIGSRQQEWAKIYDKKMQQNIIPVYCDWHLNERYYGELQGCNKDKMRELYGKEQVHLWRRSYNVCPPGGECLKDTVARTIPYFQSTIKLVLEQQQNVLVVAHGNSLRALVMHLDHLSEEDVLQLEIATGDPLIYDFPHVTQKSI